MLAKSKAQNRLMQATVHGAKTGVPMKVAKEFVAKTHHVKDLPERKEKKGK